MLAADAVEKVGNGHPGTAISLAPVAYLLFNKVMRHDPSDEKWLGRDRFILSVGHSSLTLYNQLYLHGYGLELDDLKALRTWGSLTPGHPEFGHTKGVEITTGPLGQGLASATGFAYAARFERGLFDATAKTGESPFDHFVYVIAGDGDMQEGVTAEAASLAGHQRLGNLVVIYDSNQISIEDDTDISFTESVSARYESYGWQTQTVDWKKTGNYVEDVAELFEAIQRAKAETDKPSLIILRTIIGWPSPKKQNSGKIHGSALGAEELAGLKTALGFDPEKFFEVDAEVISHTRGYQRHADSQRAAWQAWLSFARVGTSAAVVARGGARRALSLGISCWISMLQGRLAAVRRAHKAGERAARAGMTSRFEAWREALTLTKLQAELLRMAHRGLLSRWTRAWGQAGREREARRDASRRLQARSMADAIPARPLRRCWHSWHGRAAVAQRLAARVSTALLARMHRYWIEWRVWASSVERRSAVRLLTTLAISSRRRWCWQAWLRASLRVQRARVLTARSQLHHDRSAVRRVLRVLENRRDSITLALLVTMVGRLSAPLIADWVVAGAAARHAIGRALKLASELARRMGWRRWQRERTRSAEGRLLLHRARRLYSTLSAAKLGHGFQQWSVTVLSTSLRNAALEHWAEEFKPRAFANYGWRRWRAGLHRQAMAAHMASVLERRADEFAKARCAAALAMWSAAATRRLHRRMLKTRKKVAQQDDAAVERLRGLLADGRKWAERMLVADGVLPAGSPLGYPFI